jgi:gamma-D-glutamyl-L-lysine dipeptidyl-peptidase
MNLARIKQLLIPAAAVCTGLVIFVCCNSGSRKEEVMAGIDQVSKKWVPDGREGLFHVTAEQKNGNIVLRGETNLAIAKAELIELIKKPGLKIIDSIKVLPDTISNEKSSGVVTLSVINLRKEPDHAAELVSQAILGSPVVVLKNENSWLLVQTADKYIAWTDESSVALMTSKELKAWKNSDRIIFVNNSGWVYTSADETGIAGDIVAGSILQVSGKVKGYVKVLFPDDREGYVRDNEVMDFNIWKNQITTPDGIINFAHTFMGSPYLWGGSSTKATDCSGFVQSVYFNNGLILSRDASLQARHGEIIDISHGFDQIKKGDLLFFGWKDNSEQHHVTHVAIYQGDDEYIHSTGRVMINSLDSAALNFSSYRKSSLLSARRIIGIANDSCIVQVSKHHWY